jgi:prophage antirepressor-like protein
MIIYAKKFNNFKVNVYGTIQRPLFKASEIKTVIKQKGIRNAILKLKKEERVLIKSETKYRLAIQYYITINGLYNLLLKTRKKIHIPFFKWVEKLKTKKILILNEPLDELFAEIIQTQKTIPELFIDWITEKKLEKMRLLDIIKLFI